MATFRVTEVWCDLCDERHVYDNLIEARANGWRKDRWQNGQVLDLCPDCVTNVAIDTPTTGEPVAVG